MSAFFGALAFIVWGLVPIYFHQLGTMEPMLILSSRIFWSAIILVALFAYKPKLINKAQCTPKNIALAAAAGILMNLSWLGFVYATISNNIMAASLAFYITPVMVFLWASFSLKSKSKKSKNCVIFNGIGYCCLCCFR